MTKLYYADALKEITEQHMSERAQELLEVIADAAMEQATKGKYSLYIQDEAMIEIISALKHKGYKVTKLSDMHRYRISWD